MYTLSVDHYGAKFEPLIARGVPQGCGFPRAGTDLKPPRTPGREGLTWVKGPTRFIHVSMIKSARYLWLWRVVSFPQFLRQLFLAPIPDSAVSFR